VKLTIDVTAEDDGHVSERGNAKTCPAARALIRALEAAGLPTRCPDPESKINRYEDDDVVVGLDHAYAPVDEFLPDGRRRWGRAGLPIELRRRILAFDGQNYRPTGAWGSFELDFQPWERENP
jgi:hypothetical protein